MNQISPLAFVHPEAKLGDNNIIGPFCYIDKDTVLGDNNVLQNSVTIHVGARIGNNNEFFPGASISTKPQDLKFKGEVTTCEVGDNNSIRENVTISRGTASKGKTVVGSNNLLMETVHVAHDCELGSGLIIGNSTKFAGEVVVDDNAIVSANVLVHQFCHIAVRDDPGRLPFLSGYSSLHHCRQGANPLLQHQPHRFASPWFQQRDHPEHPRGLSPALQQGHPEGRYRGNQEES